MRIRVSTSEQSNTFMCAMPLLCRPCDRVVTLCLCVGWRVRVCGCVGGSCGVCVRVSGSREP